MNSLIIAFAMYSRIPVPEIDVQKDQGNYVLCFFPLVGIVIGAFELVAYHVLLLLGIGTVLRGAVLTALPLLISGGVHMNGFMAVVQARNTFGDQAKKTGVMEDPHPGMNAVLACALYLLVSAGAWIEAGWRSICIMALFFALERAAGGYCALNFRTRRGSGSLEFFTDEKSRERASNIILAECVGIFIVMALIWMPGAVLSYALIFVTMIVYYLTAESEFDGNRTELMGWFLQMAELAQLIALAILSALM